MQILALEWKLSWKEEKVKVEEDEEKESLKNIYQMMMMMLMIIKDVECIFRLSKIIIKILFNLVISDWIAERIII